jgi:hypothetical protein
VAGDKSIKSVTWYITLLLTIAIECKEIAWKVICERYIWTHQGKAIEGKPETENASNVTAMAAMIAMESSRDKQTNSAQFDTDAMTIGVDNRCTACISNNREHFVGKLIPGRKVIKGFHGSKATKVMS